MCTGMYKNLKYNSEFIANNNFLTLGFMLLGCAMMKCNRYLTLSNEITVYIRIENHVIVMQSNDHLQTSFSPIYICLTPLQVNWVMEIN